MRARLPALAAALLVAGLAPAHATGCTEAASAAERQAGVPAGLLAAIGQVESGRPDPRTGAIQPWPWTVNAAGEGRYFATPAEAAAWVDSERARGVASIDVGCFQVSLKYHPDAFATLAEGFDPVANARYAAGFLSDLARRFGNWPDAVAAYHSADAARGVPYRMQVMARLTGAPLPRPAAARLLASSPDPYVISVAAALAGFGQGRGRPLGLPRVITPSLRG